MLGLAAQNGSLNDLSNDTEGRSAAFAVTITVLLTVYYIVATGVCFCAYREFKGMMFDAGMGGGFGMGGSANRRGGNQDREERDDGNNGNSGQSI